MKLKPTRLTIVLIIAASGALVSTGVSGTLAASSAAAANPPQAQAIINAAEKWITTPVTPYCWDGGDTNGPNHGVGDPKSEYSGPAGQSGCSNSGPTASANGFDCTGLTRYAVYQALGITLPHDSSQATAAVSHGGQKITDVNALLPGDLVYFGGSLSAFIHVGVYLGNGNMVNAYDFMNDGHNGKNNKYWGVAKMPIAWETSGLAFVGGVRMWTAATPPPTVSSLTASPSTLSSAGGSVTLSANVTNATTCAFSSNRSIAGLPATIPCSNGAATESVTVPANTRKLALTYKFRLAVTGTRVVRASTGLVVDGTLNSPPIVTAISSDATHFCELLNSGKVDCSGSNQYGQLGNGTTADSSALVPVSGIVNATAIESSGYGSCAILGGGSVDCWGDNSDGELGIGTATGPDTCVNGAPCSLFPVAVTNLTGARSLAEGENSLTVCAVLSDQTVSCWGSNFSGQLGNGNNSGPDVCRSYGCSTQPLSIPGIAGVVFVGLGSRNGCALLSDKTVDCWGLADFLFTGNWPSGYNTPASITGIHSAVSIGIGGGTFCAIVAGGSVGCWGDVLIPGNALDGTATPVTITNLVGPATSIASDEEDSCAIVSGGSVECWGFNNFGDLGNGSQAESGTPVTVTGISNAKQITAGEWGFCTLNADGSVDCWGNGSATPVVQPLPQ